MNTGGSQPELYDIYDMWHIPFWQTTLFASIFIGLGLLLLLGLALYLFLRFRAKKQKESSWEQALRKLNGLQPAVCTTKEEGKIFYFELTAILKNYFYERYGFHIKGKTDQEFLKFSFPDELQPLLHEIFSGCLQIKYADESALQKQLIRDHNHAIQIIQQTCPSENK